MPAIRWLFALALLAATHAWAACPSGMPSDRACAGERVALEKKLAAAYRAKEAWLRKEFDADYGGATEDGYYKEAIRSFRAANAAWKKFRDQECWFQALNDGMNMYPDYASDVAEACKVDMTRERLKSMLQQPDPQEKR